MSCEACKKDFAPGDKRFIAEEKDYHEACFTCSECKEPVGSRSFYKMGDGNVCSDCVDKNHSKTCKKCGEKLVGGGVKVGDDTYHSGCFTCGACNKELAGVSFNKVENKNICSECFAKDFAKMCAGCSKALTGSWVTVGDNGWHKDCFNCCKCTKALGDKFYPGASNTEMLCGDCVK